MAQLEFTTNNIRRIPITRNNLFYSEKDFQYEMELGKEYLERDLNQTIILYSVDLEKTNLDAVYGESKQDGIVFKTPVELHCVYEIESPELQSYDKTKNLGTYVKTGNLKFGVYQATLDELEIDIKVGDYVGIATNEHHIEFFCVTNDGRNNYDNAHMVFGYKPAWRDCLATYVDTNEFNG